MSLQVWLPLDGDLRNQGLSSQTANITTVPIWSTVGKLGNKSLYTKTRMTTMNFPGLIGVSTYSVAYWLYIPTEIATAAWKDMFGIAFNCAGTISYERDERRAATTTGRHNYHLAKSANEGSNTNAYYGTIDDDNANDRWVHYILIKNDTNARLYMNGQLVITIPNEKFEVTKRTMTGEVYLGDNGCEGYLQDFRIYDHALSLREVKELSKGLILHYKLSKPMPNLANGTNTLDLSLNSWSFSNQVGGITKAIEYDEYGIPCIKITRDNVNQSGWSYFSYNRIQYSNIKTNTIYTISFDIKPSVDGTINMLGFMQTNATNNLSQSNKNIQNSLSANTWNHIILQTTTKSDFSGLTVGSQIIYMSASASLKATGTTMLLKNMKLEEGIKETPWIPNESDPLYSALGYDSNIEPDCSGYKRDGIITGTLTAAADTPRYRTSYYFDGSSYINSKDACRIKDAITVSCWVKPETTSGSPVSCIQSGGWGWQSNLTSYLGTDNNGSNAYVGSKSLSTVTGVWMHIALTFDGTTVSNYLNGSLISTATCPKREIYYNTNGALFIGGECNGNMDAPISIYKGNISDVRVYCTALSAADIKALYDDAGYVDKNGNFHAYEYSEF